MQRLVAPRLRTRSHDDRELIEHDRSILDEHGIGHLGFSREPLDLAAENPECGLVRLVLRPGAIEVDLLAFDVRALARREGGRDVPGEGEKAHRAAPAAVGDP